MNQEKILHTRCCSLIALVTVIFLLFADCALSQENTPENQSESIGFIDPSCKFEYWQLIPEDLECDVFYLPDFNFRRLPEDPQVDIKLKRFCESFEIRYGITSKVVSYCKEPEKDGSGPSFDINGVQHQADIYFEGCYKGKSTYGKLFTNAVWASAPSYVKRIWRIKDRNTRLPDCSKVK